MDLVLWQMTDGSVLAGSAAGRQLFERLWKSAQHRSAPEAVFIDFTDIDVATSSFLREGIVAFRRRVREERSSLYPVVVNLKPEIEEELSGLLEQMGEAIWVAELSNSLISNRRLVGRLDPKLKETLDLVEARQNTDASALWAETRMAESVGVTAWNNRLASLSKQGLVLEERRGKQKTYRILDFAAG